jgi:hypothetical protein
MKNIISMETTLYSNFYIFVKHFKIFIKEWSVMAQKLIGWITLFTQGEYLGFVLSSYFWTSVMVYSIPGTLEDFSLKNNRIRYKF